ncbi:MAG TPA: hypothetical protein PLP01_03955 [Phycisphaerae bacterium]|nr:hypothetical protein [Phycisphaerae bacterium]HOI54380.1 hypothetical protein [Phycisphaerae bacterium]
MDVYRPRFHLADRKRKNRDGMVLARRLLSKAWKPSVDNEQLSLWLVEPLSPEETEQLQRYVAEHHEVMQEFEQFHKPFGILLNLTVDFPGSLTVPQLEAVFSDIKNVGLTSDEIVGHIESSPLGLHVAPGIHRAMLQFYSPECEVRDQEYVYRELRVRLP